MYKYIVIEGLDYSGKSTAIKNLLPYFTSEVTVVREPGGTTFGEGIRKLVLEQQTEQNRLSKNVELLAMMAQRANLFDKVINPALAEGKTVLSDRNVVSTYVYQTVPENEDLLTAILHRLPEIRTPDAYIFLDIDYKTYLERSRGRGVEHPCFDVMDEASFRARRERYMTCPHVMGARCFQIDSSNKSSEDLAKLLYDVIAQ